MIPYLLCFCFFFSLAWRRKLPHGRWPKQQLLLYTWRFSDAKCKRSNPENTTTSEKKLRKALIRGCKGRKQGKSKKAKGKSEGISFNMCGQLSIDCCPCFRRDDNIIDWWLLFRHPWLPPALTIDYWLMTIDCCFSSWSFVPSHSAVPRACPEFVEWGRLWWIKIREICGPKNRAIFVQNCA